MNRQVAVAIVTTVVGIVAGGCTLDRSGELFGPGCSEECRDAGSDGTTDSGKNCPEGCDAGAGGMAGAGGAGGTAGEGGTAGAGGGCEPTEEVCDGKDNDCNGETDEADPMLNQACTTGLDGVCAAGTYSCESGGLVCNQTTQSSQEVCDNTDDDDCDGDSDCDDSDCTNDPNCIVGGILNIPDQGCLKATIRDVNGVEVDGSQPGSCNGDDSASGNPGLGGAAVVWITANTLTIYDDMGTITGIYAKCSSVAPLPTTQAIYNEFTSGYPAMYTNVPFTPASPIVATTNVNCPGGIWSFGVKVQ